MAAKPPINEERVVAERRQDILLLLQHLARHEETTIKLILDCLYDIGAVKLIDRKVPMPGANRALKKVARWPKPIFRIYALRWFQGNCPELIANWLYSKVQSAVEPPPPKPKPEALASPAESSPPEVPEAVAAQVVSPPIDALLISGEVRQLRTQVKLLTGTLVLAIAALGATVVWMGTETQWEVLRLVRTDAEQGDAMDQTGALIAPPTSIATDAASPALCLPAPSAIQAQELMTDASSGQSTQ